MTRGGTESEFGSASPPTPQSQMHNILEKVSRRSRFEIAARMREVIPGRIEFRLTQSHIETISIRRD
jgi:hypothetical protein